jgi:hypothetical protein
MSVELPKDAEGREIPLDTKVLYDSDGIEFFTDKSMYMRVTDEWWFFGHFGSLTSTHRIAATRLHLTSPDSWEKLEEDLGRGADALNYEACAYFGKNACNCSSCIADKGETCERVVMCDIASRIRKLRGEC